MGELKLSSNAPIGIFDSGVGGLSILREIHKQLAHEDLIYIADSAHAPYGDKSTEFIQQRSLALAQFLVNEQAKAIVIACNTATTEAIAHLRQHLEIPVVGVEPAIKPAAEHSKTRIIGILATQRTIQSRRLEELVHLYAKDATVIAQPCPGLVEAVEKSDAGQKQLAIDLLHHYTKEMKASGADTIILGCTHYPFLIAELRHVLGEEITILETGKPVATQLLRILQLNQIENDTSRLGNIRFYSSLYDAAHHNIIRNLWSPNIEIHPLLVESKNLS